MDLFIISYPGTMYITFAHILKTKLMLHNIFDLSSSSCYLKFLLKIFSWKYFSNPVAKQLIFLALRKYWSIRPRCDFNVSTKHSHTWLNPVQITEVGIFTNALSMSYKDFSMARSPKVAGLCSVTAELNCLLDTYKIWIFITKMYEYSLPRWTPDHPPHPF